MRWRNIIFTAFTVSILVIAVLALIVPVPEPELDEQTVALSLANAKVALSSSDYSQAETLAAMVPKSSPLFSQSRLVAGEAASRDARNEAAKKYYLEIAEGSTQDSLLAAYSAAEILRSECQLEQACNWYKQVLSRDPNDAASHERLAFILGVTHQHWESALHHFALVKLRSWSLDSLAILADVERSVEQPAFVDLCEKLAPQESLTLLARAAELIYEGNGKRATPLLQQVVVLRPELSAAQALLGEQLLLEDPLAFASWNEKLPPNASEHPDIWFVRGLWCRKNQKFQLAAGCFAIAVSKIPEHRRANYQLGQMLTQLGAPGAEAFVQRAKWQAELGQMLDQVLASRGLDEPRVRKVAELSESLGRLWEAAAWASTAAKLHPPASWPEPLARRCEALLTTDMPRTIKSANLLAHIDLQTYIGLARSNDWSSNNSVLRSATGAIQANLKSNIRFEREQEVGIDFVFQNGADPKTAGARMFEQTGGGVGVLDYDNDGWPDLHFTQGAEWKTGEYLPTLLPDVYDCLYRNRDGVSFDEQSANARVFNSDFSQGLAVGDFDADGFADLLICNIGKNQLLRNNGDGTFGEVTQLLGDQQAKWSTSSVFCDLNRDGLLDIFVVTYLQGKEVYRQICGEKGCSPKVFDGDVDLLWLNRGDGTFEFLADACPSTDSKGLGVLAFSMGEPASTTLFIANDQVPNFLLVPELLDGNKLKLNDEAVVRGLAFNADGLALAGMGIAAEDIDQNGYVDLLVSNFANEPNTLYKQDAPGLFTDATQSSGMQTVSFPFVGWGTQFFDANLDGAPDAVVVNGHIDDYRSSGGEYEMIPHFYQNVGGGKFQVANAADVGDYFGRKYLGRGVAKLDWNRDGLIDFAVSNIGSKAALVTNKSTPVGNYCNVRLYGVEAARDPIGSIVSMTTDRGVWVKQLVAGDGFQSSNERFLQFGLGDASTIKSLEVKWPSGRVTSFSQLPLNSNLEIVEGKETYSISQRWKSDTSIKQP